MGETNKIWSVQKLQYPINIYEKIKEGNDRDFKFIHTYTQTHINKTSSPVV